MRRPLQVMVALALTSCASTWDRSDGGALTLGGSAPTPGDDRQAVCVTSIRFDADLYGREAFLAGMREAFEESGFPLERQVPGTREWVPAGTLPNRYRLAACDSTPGARRLQLVMGLSSPLFEQQVATPWGGAYTLAGVRCEWHMDSPGVAADALSDGRCTAYYRGWTTRGGALTAEMGVRFGEVFLAALHRRSGALTPDARIVMPEVMEALW